MAVFRGSHYVEGGKVTMVGTLDGRQVGGEHAEHVIRQMLEQVPVGRNFVLTLGVQAGPSEKPVSAAVDQPRNCPQF